tara:strand:- start:5147 stop:5422 length:276 start_codon:yes stop_codon:yes gene_type:complete
MTTAFQPDAFQSDAFQQYGGGGGGGGGSTVLVFSGVSRAGGLTGFSGLSSPVIALTDAGGGTYNVTITHQLHGEKSDTVSDISYLIDGNLP